MKMGWIETLRNQDRAFILATIARYDANNLSPSDVLDELDREIDIWGAEAMSWEDPLLLRLVRLYGLKLGEDHAAREFVSVLEWVERDTIVAIEKYHLREMLGRISAFRDEEMSAWQLRGGLWRGFEGLGGDGEESISELEELRGLLYDLDDMVDRSQANRVQGNQQYFGVVGEIEGWVKRRLEG